MTRRWGELWELWGGLTQKLGSNPLLPLLLCLSYKEDLKLDARVWREKLLGPGVGIVEDWRWARGN